MPLVLSSLIVALSLAGGIQAPPAADADLMLDVPYLHQTDAMCGGAAVAMVFRYWGDAHAGIEQFDPIVDRHSGGILTTRLVDAVEARRWRTETGHAVDSIDALRAELGARRPIVVLLEDRPRRYHYVVVVGAGADRIVVHDPSWGPSRPIPLAEFVRRWQAARFWSLVILPPAGGLAVAAAVSADAQAPPSHDKCDLLLEAAVDRVRQDGLAVADGVFASVRASCPESSGPLRELAGVRFAEHRWREAASLAEAAVARDPHNTYAWDVLASSRFVQNDVAGALDAWNRIGKPRVDDVRIEGLAHTRYALVAGSMELQAGTLLTTEKFRRAERRIDELPDQSGARVAYRPQSDGFASVDVAIVERASRPHGPTAWAVEAAQAAANREIVVDEPGPTGQGELWTASWRWWNDRPRAAIAFATPHAGVLPGVWRVEGSWEAQTYAAEPAARAGVREERAHGGLSIADWLSADLRYEVRAGVDSWNGVRRAASAGGALERRLFNDRVSIGVDATAWLPIANGLAFQTAGLHAAFRSSAESAGVVTIVDGGLNATSAAAPLALWNGAGDGHARDPLLRAHPLLRDGIVAGPVFGRRLAYANGEVQRWLGGALPVRFAIAGFVDLAGASERSADAPGAAFQIDAGVGLRVRVPGQRGTLRVDVGRGVLDGAHALTFGWQF